VIDLTTEATLTLAAACKLLPPGRGNRKPHFSTLCRWVTRGVKSPTGEVVRLEALRVGAKWITSRQALQRFAEKLTPRLDSDPLPTLRSPAARRRDSERAEKELARHGI
jgi:hypothetical protein